MHGILFRPESITAIVEGSKTHTRRLAGLKEVNKNPDNWELMLVIPDSLIPSFYSFYRKERFDICIDVKPPYRPGGTVYVKEALYCHPCFKEACYYDGAPVFVDQTIGDMLKWRWKRSSLSPMFMPEEAARYFLTITSVEVKRLWDMTEEDAIAEGAEYQYMVWRDYKLRVPNGVPHAKLSFVSLWNSINKKYPWVTNPWCFDLTFQLKED